MAVWDELEAREKLHKSREKKMYCLRGQSFLSPDTRLECFLRGAKFLVKNLRGLKITQKILRGMKNFHHFSEKHSNRVSGHKKDWLLR